MGENNPPDHRKDRDEIPVPDESILIIGEFRIDVSARKLMKGDARVMIQHKPLDVLIYLAENSSRLVTREELLEKFWPRAVNEEALTRCISTIRKNLGDIEDPPRYIETLWGQGYRCIKHVSIRSRNDQDSEQAPSPEQEITELYKTDYWLGRLFARVSRFRSSMILAVLLLILIGLTVDLRNEKDTEIDDIERIAVLPIKATDDEDWIASAMTDQLI